MPANGTLLLQITHIWNGKNKVFYVATTFLLFSFVSVWEITPIIIGFNVHSKRFDFVVIDDNDLFMWILDLLTAKIYMVRKINDLRYKICKIYSVVCIFSIKVLMKLWLGFSR